MTKRSLDGGRTWGDLAVIFDPFAVLGNATCTAGPESKDACAAWDPTPVFDADTGVVHVLVAAAASEQDRMTGTGTVWALKSSDLGATWSPPLNITDQLYVRRADRFL